jgi:hypothetical protein
LNSFLKLNQFLLAYIGSARRFHCGNSIDTTTYFEQFHPIYFISLIPLLSSPFFKQCLVSFIINITYFNHVHLLVPYPFLFPSPFILMSHYHHHHHHYFRSRFHKQEKNMQYRAFWAWFISLNMISSSTHFLENGMISFFFMAE